MGLPTGFLTYCAQTVELLIFDALTGAERSAMPPELASAWQRAALQRLGRNEQLLYDQTQILAALKDAQIPCAVLKGSFCAQSCPDPALRCAGDIDLLVGKAGIATARKMLESLGYTASEEPHPFHLHMRKGAQVVELHHEPAGIPDGEMGEALRRFFAGAEQRAQTQNALPVLPVKEQAITLLLHKLEHIVSSGLGLRQLCDWAAFVHARLTAEEWQHLEPVLQDFRLLHFARVVTRMCVDGLYLPAGSAPLVPGRRPGACPAASGGHPSNRKFRPQGKPLRPAPFYRCQFRQPPHKICEGGGSDLPQPLAALRAISRAPACSAGGAPCPLPETPQGGPASCIPSPGGL